MAKATGRPEEGAEIAGRSANLRAAGGAIQQPVPPGKHQSKGNDQEGPTIRHKGPVLTLDDIIAMN